MTKAYWFMDVDGVLNMFPRGTPPKDIKRGEATPFQMDKPYAGNTMFPITWSPSVLKRIRQMHEEGLVEVVWMTTWGRGVKYGLAELLDLPDFEVAADPEDHPYRSMGWQSWWKAHAVRAFIEERNPSKIVWTDDDLMYHKDKVQDIHEAVDSMLICPQEHQGLTHRQLDKIEAFLRKPDVQTVDDGVK